MNIFSRIIEKRRMRREAIAEEKRKVLRERLISLFNEKPISRGAARADRAEKVYGETHAAKG